MPRFRTKAAELFAAGEGRGWRMIPPSARQKLHSQGTAAGFGPAEMLIVMQILALLWQLWQLQKNKDPKFSPVNNTSADGDIGAAYDEIDLDKD